MSNVIIEYGGKAVLIGLVLAFVVFGGYMVFVYLASPGGGGGVDIVIPAPTSTATPIPTTKAVEYGTLQIKTTPTGATVYVDGNNKGFADSTLTINHLTEGVHQIRITKDGYYDYMDSVSLSAGDNSYILVSLNIKPTPTAPATTELEDTTTTIKTPTEFEQKKILAEAGDADAQCYIALSYYHGENGAMQDSTQAVYWYRKAAEQGSADGMYNLGMCYELGSGVIQDASLAEVWYRKAAALGKSDAIEKVKQIDAANKLGTSSDNPIQISSATEFMNIYSELGKHYRLTNDIDISGQNIPTQSVFTGTLDGCGHTISGSGYMIYLGTSEFSSERSFGLFSENRGTIKNVVLQNFDLMSEYAQHSGAWANLGCMAGENYGTIDSVQIISCDIECNRAGSASGLICGKNFGTINNSEVVKGHILTNGDAGGISGWNSGDIIACTVTGNGPNGKAFLDLWGVAATYGDNTGKGRSLGGIVGYAGTDSSLIEGVTVSDVLINAYMSGVTSAMSAGYICGANHGTIESPYSVSDVRATYGSGILGGPASAHSWFKGYNGYTGYNDGTVPW